MPLIFLIVLLSSSLSFATGLINRYQYLNASVLPKEVWTFATVIGQSLGPGERSYSGSGNSISNENFFSKDLSYGNLVDEVSDPVDKELAQAAFDEYGRDNNQRAGRVVNDVSITQKSNVYVLGRGLSNKTSMFLAFPVVTIRTQFNSRFQHDPSLLQLAQQLREEGQYLKAQEILEKSQNALSTKLSENGYRSSYPTEITTLANVFMTLRYQAIDQKKFKLASDMSLVVPSGKKFDQDDFLPMRINEEQFSLRPTMTAGYSPDYRFSFFTSTYYHKRFAFEKTRRIPGNEVNPLSNDVDRTTTQYGDTFGGSAQFNYSHNELFTFYVGQSFEYRNQDQVKGTRFESRRYNYLEQDTDQRLGIGYGGVAVNTIRSFMAKKFIIPIDVNIQYSFTNSGKNALDNKAIAMNMMVFYK